ncbi:hypothetical protein TA3x_001591 [Tundrisphaera sp. TA3]|uniref:hypothetical protein n=1 Tax=Tundrisphaera sp. TA3 TaxID=3435775 RepID=UPI003EBFC7B9
MSNQNWGECKSCRHFEIEPAASAAANTMGLCIVHEHEMQHLRVSGSCGCDLHADGQAAHAKGASRVPPGDSR